MCDSLCGGASEHLESLSGRLMTHHPFRLPRQEWPLQHSQCFAGALVAHRVQGSSVPECMLSRTVLVNNLLMHAASFICV